MYLMESLVYIYVHVKSSDRDIQVHSIGIYIYTVLIGINMLGLFIHVWSTYTCVCIAPDRGSGLPTFEFFSCTRKMMKLEYKALIPMAMTKPRLWPVVNATVLWETAKQKEVPSNTQESHALPS